MKTILVPIDFSPITAAVVAEATALAHARKGQIILLHVVQPPVVMAGYGEMFESSVPVIEAADRAAARLLAHWQKDLKKRRLVSKTIRAEGFPSTAILRQAEKLKVDCIVMGSHGHTAFYDLLMGSTTSGVLKKARCPVLVVPVRPKSKRTAKR